MEFSLDKTTEILRRTPDVLIGLLESLSDEWTKHNEGGDSWSPYEILAHLIEGEKTDWVPRLEIIMENTSDKRFEAFDRLAHQKNGDSVSINSLLDEFKQRRVENLGRLEALNLSEGDLDKTGIHPEFGEVTVRQLLSTWAVHDLSHLSQIGRVMAKQYETAIGPWITYFNTLKVK